MAQLENLRTQIEDLIIDYKFYDESTDSTVNKIMDAVIETFSTVLPVHELIEKQRSGSNEEESGAGDDYPITT